MPSGSSILTPTFLVNGCIDDLVQSPYYAIFANHNPYNITAISEREAEDSLYAFFMPGGCRDKIIECRNLQKSLDPLNLGDNAIVNLACRKANDFCGVLPSTISPDVGTLID